MKNILLFSVVLFFARPVAGQSLLLRHDTVFVDKVPLLEYKLDKSSHKLDICRPGGEQLIEVHNGHVEPNGKPGWVVTFLNDERQCMVVWDGNFPLSFFEEIIRNHLFKKGGTVNAEAELKFIKSHPMPDGYTDVDRLIEY